MGRAPCCSKVGLHRGPWTPREDALLTKYIQAHGKGQWRSLPKTAGNNNLLTIHFLPPLSIYMIPPLDHLSMYNLPSSSSDLILCSCFFFGVHVLHLFVPS